MGWLSKLTGATHQGKIILQYQNHFPFHYWSLHRLSSWWDTDLNHPWTSWWNLKYWSHQKAGHDERANVSNNVWNFTSGEEWLPGTARGSQTYNVTLLSVHSHVDHGLVLFPARKIGGKIPLVTLCTILGTSMSSMECHQGVNWRNWSHPEVRIVNQCMCSSRFLSSELQWLKMQRFYWHAQIPAWTCENSNEYQE